MLTPLPLIRASHITPIVKQMDALAIPTSELLTEVGITREQLEQPNQLILESRLCDLLLLASKKTALPYLSSCLTENSPLAEYGAFQAQLLKAKNLATALRLLQRYVGLHNNNRQFWLEEEQGSFWLCGIYESCCKQGRWQIEQHVLNLMCRLVEYYAGSGWVPNKVKLQSLNTQGIENSHYLKSAKLQRNQTYSAIAIEPSLLDDEKIVEQDQLVEGLEPVPKNFTSGFKSLLKANYFGEEWLAENIASTLGMSVRTLKRKLQAQETSLREVFDETRFQQARELIEQGMHDYKKLSEKLSYTHPNNFVRAFKRWSGITPREYIRRFNQAKFENAHREVL